MSDDEVKKTGELWVTWTHVDGCPGNVHILSPDWPKSYELCTCGMPSYGELDILGTTAEESWQKRVENGETDRDGY